MRSTNRNRTSSGENFFWEIALILVVIFGALTFRALRSLRRPNTRDYRPIAYDRPYSRGLGVEYVSSLGAVRLIYGLILLFTLVIASILLPNILTGTVSTRQTFPLIAITILSLLSVLLSLLSIPTALAVATASFLLYSLQALVIIIAPQGNTLFPSLMMCGAIVLTGISLLLSCTIPGRERDFQPVWLESASVVILLLTISTLAGFSGGPIVALELTAIVLLSTVLISPSAQDSERLQSFLLLLCVLVALVAVGLRPNTSIGSLLFIFSTAIAFFPSVFRKKLGSRITRVDASFLSNPSPFSSPRSTLIVLPPKQEFAPQVASALIAAILKLSNDVGLSIVSQATEGIVWQVSTSEDNGLLSQIEADIASHAKGSILVRPESQTPKALPLYRQVLLFGLANDYAAPLPFIEQLTTHDPLSLLTQRMSEMTAYQSEKLSYEVVVTAATLDGRDRALRRLQQGKIRPLAALFYDPDKPLEGLSRERVTAKLEQPNNLLYHCFIALTIECSELERLQILSQAAQDVEQYYSPGHNRLILTLQTTPYRVETNAIAYQHDITRLLEEWKRGQSNLWRDALCVLSIPEIAALWHLPSSNYAGAEIAWAQARVPEELLDPTNGIPFGETITPGMRGKTVYLKPHDRATSHYIAGKPGTGKSTLMHTLIHADIQAGNGLAVIDPQGSLIADVIASSIPATRLNDVVLLEVRRTDYPVPLNLFRRPPGVTIPEAYNLLLSALAKIYESIWIDGQTANYIRYMIQLLLTDKDATPLDIERVFRDDNYRNRLLNQFLSDKTMTGLPTASMKQFWEFYGKRGGEHDKIFAPISNRTELLKQTEIMELMTCHPDYFDFKRMIRDKKIVLVDLSGDNLRNDVDTIATLFVTGFFLGAHSLGIQDKKKKHPPRFYLYVDEIERTVTAPFTDILAESRKYGLTTILANQYLDQIPENLLSGIVGTVGITTAFELGIKDASFLARHFEPELTSSDLGNLSLHHVAVKMRSGEKTLPAMILKTIRPNPVEDGIDIETLRRQAEQGLKPASAVRAWIDARYSGNSHNIDVPLSPSTGGKWTIGNETVDDTEDIT